MSLKWKHTKALGQTLIFIDFCIFLLQSTAAQDASKESRKKHVNAEQA